MVDNKQQWKAWLYLSPAIVLLLVFTLWPIVNTVVMAFTEGYSGLQAVGGRAFEFGLGNFIKVIQSHISDAEGFDPTFNEDNFYVGGTFGVYMYSKDRGMEKVEPSSLGSATYYSEDPDNPSTVVITLANGVSQIFIIEK